MADMYMDYHQIVLFCSTDQKTEFFLLYYVLVAHVMQIAWWFIITMLFNFTTKTTQLKKPHRVVPPVSGFIELVSIIYCENLNTV